MTHILIITTSFPDKIPGSEAAGSFVADFAEEFAKHITVTVLAPGAKNDAYTYGNIQMQRYAVPILPLSSLSPSKPWHWWSIIKTLHSGNRILEKIIQANDIDHIFALWALPSGYWARKAGKKHGVPYSIWALGSDIWTLRHIPIVATILRKVLKDSKHCFADGLLLRDDVTAISGRECHFLPSTRRLESSRTKILSEHPPYKFAYLGRWHVNKGIDLLMDALHFLEDKDWLLIKEVKIAGGGALEHYVSQHASILLDAGRPIVVHGYLNKKEAIDLLEWADYLLIPSRIESIPVVFSDALQCMCPVVCTPVGDLPRLVHDLDVGVCAKQVSALNITEAIVKSLNQCPPHHFKQQLISAATQFNLGHIVETALALLFPGKETTPKPGSNTLFQ